MTPREQTEQIERETLSRYAALAERTGGRQRPDDVCPFRTAYQVDRDRIIHSKSFRRLMHKTQVFLFAESDHYRTRLTHTLEVGQIARTISRALRLNEDLTEAIAMGHDLGHTPFGHTGERVLKRLSPGGFRHNEQSVRVVERLENNGKGLNLTAETRNGILCHPSEAPDADTLEGRVVAFADKIAYMNHDIDDAIRSGVLREEDLPETLQQRIGSSKSRRITTFVRALVENSTDDIVMDPETLADYRELRSFLFENVYRIPSIMEKDRIATGIVSSLYEYFITDACRLPAEYRRIADEEGADRAVCDYISGMTDRFCIRTYEQIISRKGVTL